MIVPPEQISELLTGERDDVLIAQDPPKVDTVHPLQPAVGKRAKCRVRVLEAWPHKDGGHVVRCEVVPDPHTPRLLRPNRAGGGYTATAHRALRGPDEAEAVPRDYQDRITDEARMLGHQENVRREITWRERDFLERLEDEILESQRLGLPTHREMTRLEQGLSKLKRRNALARQQSNGKAA